MLARSVGLVGLSEQKIPREKNQTARKDRLWISRSDETGARYRRLKYVGCASDFLIG
jgi:hypothetical protein